MVRISIRNPMLNSAYPDKGSVLAVLDTGYSGFLFVPPRIFKRLGLNKMKTKKSSALLADGSSSELTGAFGSVIFPNVNNLTVDGLIETSEGASEILIGMDGLKKMLVTIDFCVEMVNLEGCF